MKVIQILPKIKTGGVERGVLDLVRFFSSDQDPLELESIVVSSGGDLLYLLDQWKIPHYQIRVDRKSLLSLREIPKVAKLILREKPDIIHARSRVPAWISFFASRNKSCHFLTTAHGVYRNKFSSEVMGWGKFVICPSKVVAKHMKSKFGVPEEKIVIIPRWVDLDSFRFVDYHSRLKSNSIFALGRITPSKGYEHLIKAFSRVVRHNPYLKLKIVGSVDQSKEKYLTRLKTLVARFSLNYNVEFIGFRQDVEKVLTEARILVVPSLIEESFGRVVVEAGACGVPVIASKVGGLEEIIDHGKDGLLVPPADPAALSESILKLLNDSSLAQGLSIQARKKVEKKYTMQESLTRIKSIYQRSIIVKRILITKVSSLGDLILAIPSLAQLRRDFPEGQIYLLTSKEYASLFYDCPYINKVIAVSSKYKKIKEIFKISKKLRRFSFDYIVDLQNNRSTQLITFLSFPRKSFGFKRKLGFLFNYTAEYKQGQKISPLDSQERILKLLGLRFQEKELKFWGAKSSQIDKFGLEGNNFIGIAISASLRRPAKNWPLENINHFIKIFLKEYPDYRILLIGDKCSQGRANKISNFNKTNRIIDLSGKTRIRELIEVFKKQRVFIAPDTATLHLAQSLGVETIALFGPTNPKIHTVPGSNLHIIDKRLSCCHCYRNVCQSHECMKKISPKEVFLKVQNILNY